MATIHFFLTNQTGDFENAANNDANLTTIALKYSNEKCQS